MEEQLNKLKEFLKIWGIDPDEKKLDDHVAKRLSEDPEFFESVIPLIQEANKQLSEMNEKLKEEKP